MSARTRNEDGRTLYQGVFTCPHCGHENGHWFSRTSQRPEIVLCDNEDGGCDTYFAVTAIVEINVAVTAHKVEGVEPRVHPLDQGVLIDDEVQS